MAKVQDFNTYVDSQFGSKSNNSHIKEGFMDSLANAIDSIMPFSKTKTVNFIVDNILEYEKEMLEAKYDHMKDLEAKRRKMKELDRTDPNYDDAVKAIKNELESKEKQYKAMIKSKTVAIERGRELMRKEAIKSPRLKEIIKAKEAEMDILLAEFEYDLAKKISAEAEEIQNLKDAIQKAKDDAKEMLDKLKNP